MHRTFSPVGTYFIYVLYISLSCTISLSIINKTAAQTAISSRHALGFIDVFPSVDIPVHLECLAHVP